MFILNSTSVYTGTLVAVITTSLTLKRLPQNKQFPLNPSDRWQMSYQSIRIEVSAGCWISERCAMASCTKCIQVLHITILLSQHSGRRIYVARVVEKRAHTLPLCPLRCFTGLGHTDERNRIWQGVEPEGCTVSVVTPCMDVIIALVKLCVE